MEIGKLSPRLLEDIILNEIANKPKFNKEVLLNSKIGEDCAVLDFSNEHCVISSDPITGASANIGYLAVHINVNDVAACGCLPVGILVTILLPKGAHEQDLKDIMDGVLKATNELGVDIIGGHTEITDAVNRPIVSCSIVGKSVNQKTIKTGGALVSQDLVMTKFAGLEGTSIIANDFYETLSKHFDEQLLNDAKSRIGMVSVLKESIIAANFGATAMHDVTEGGVLGACYEMAVASNVGVEVFVDEIPILDETRKLCNFYNVDPLKLISSGSMLIATFDGNKLVDKLKSENINATIIGKVTNEEIVTISNGTKSPILQTEADEIYKIH